MSITLSIRNDAILHAKPATITARQLAAFRSFAREQGELIGTENNSDFGYLAFDFEARVCPFALATIAALFDYDEAVISIVEEAQFEGLNVRFWKDLQTDTIIMVVAPSVDGTRSMELADFNARALLDVLGANEVDCDDLDLAEVVNVIGDPATRRHLEREGMAAYLEQLDAMASQPSLEGKRLVWA